MIHDSAGNFFGTSTSGGEPCGCGAVFELSPNSSGEWTYTNLYSFPLTDGGLASPDPGGLVLDKKGDLYGVASMEGIVNENCRYGCGFIYELSPTSSGTWRYSTLYSFQGGTDGSYPWGSLILDAAGNLYGTAALGGIAGAGTVFELVRGPENTWSESVLYAFTGSSANEAFPSGLVLDASGNLYGVTPGNVAPAYGTVFELTPGVSGSPWTLNTLYNFAGPAQRDGAFPSGNLVFDKEDLLGTTSEGGDPACADGGGCGTVFALSPSAREWGEHVLHRFQEFDGQGPRSGLALDAAGNVYGSTPTGGTGDCGTVFVLSRSDPQFVTLYDFPGGSYGCEPDGRLTLGPAGTIYGTAETSGAFTLGTAFELQPQ